MNVDRIFRINAHTGAKIWSHQVAEYDGIPGAFSRTTPALDRGSVIFGDQNGAHLIAVDKDKGNRVWMTQLDPHPAAIISQSPIVYGNRVYVGGRRRRRHSRPSRPTRGACSAGA